MYLTFEEVKSYIESLGFTLLSTQYENYNTELIVKCDKGHEFKTTLKRLKFSSSECPICRKLKSYYNVKEIFNKQGFELLTKGEEFKSTKQKFKVKCPKGHISDVLLNNFKLSIKNGLSGCQTCSFEKRTLDFSIVKEKFEEKNWIVLSKKEDYKNNKTPLKVICDKGHEIEICYNHFCTKNTPCWKCNRENKTGNKAYTYEEVKEVVEKAGFELLSKEKDFVNAESLIKIKCKKGHITETKARNFISNLSCRICGRKRQADKKRNKIEDIKKYIESFGYELVECDYKDSFTPMTLRCPEGHLWTTIWNTFHQGSRCPVCVLVSRAKIYSEEELEKFKIYRRAAEQKLERVYRRYKKLINPNNLVRGRGKYNIDHIYSVIDGFINKVEINVISSPANLRMLTEHENFKKNGNSDITLEELNLRYENFIKENPEYLKEKKWYV